MSLRRYGLWGQWTREAKIEEVVERETKGWNEAVYCSQVINCRGEDIKTLIVANKKEECIVSSFVKVNVSLVPSKSHKGAPQDWAANEVREGDDAWLVFSFPSES